jgi:putative membrane protein
MMWGWNGPWDWFWMSLMMLAFVGLACGVIVWIARYASRPGPGEGFPPKPPPEQFTPQRLLEERFARGEIDQEEFEQRSKVLASQKR